MIGKTYFSPFIRTRSNIIFMKTAIFIFLSLLSASLFAQKDYLSVNEDSIRVDTFKTLYKNNIENEGMATAVDNYITYQLMLQKAHQLRVDTTLYYKTLYKKGSSMKVGEIMDSLILTHAKDYNLSPDSIAQNQRKGLINQILLDIALKNIQTDSLAMKKVLKKAGKNFLNKTKPLTFKKNRPIWTTPTGQYTQQDLVKALNEAQSNVEKETELQDLVKNNIPFLRNKFAFDDLSNHLETYFPTLRERQKELKKIILSNYVIEHEIYRKADLDSVGKLAYLQKHKEAYTWPVRYDLQIFRYLDKADALSIEKQLKEGIPAKKIMEKYKDKSKENQPLVVFNQGLVSTKAKSLGGNFNPKKTYQLATFRNATALIYNRGEIPPSVMTIKEAGVRLTEAYRNVYFLNSIKAFRKGAKISVPKSLISE